MVGRPSRRSRSGLRPFWSSKIAWEAPRRSGNCPETLPKVRNWSGDPLRGPELHGRPSRNSGTARETLPEVRKWSEILPLVRNWSGDTPGGQEVV